MGRTRGEGLGAERVELGRWRADLAQPSQSLYGRQVIAYSCAETLYDAHSRYVDHHSR